MVVDLVSDYSLNYIDFLFTHQTYFVMPALSRHPVILFYSGFYTAIYGRHYKDGFKLLQKINLSTTILIPLHVIRGDVNYRS